MTEKPSGRSSGLSQAFSQLGLGVSLGIATIACAMIMTNAYKEAREAQNSIQVKGYAEKRIVSENAVWEGVIYASDETLTQASKKLESLRLKALELLKKEGYTNEHITVGSIQRNMIYKKSPDGNHDTNDIERYNLSQSLMVQSTDVHKMELLPERVNHLAFEGFDINPGRVRFYYPSDKLDELKVSLLGDASKSARDRAEQLARRNNGNLGRLLKAQQGIFQVCAPNTSDVSDFGMYDTSSIEKIVKIVVTINYAIQ